MGLRLRRPIPYSFQRSCSVNDLGFAAMVHGRDNLGHAAAGRSRMTLFGIMACKIQSRLWVQKLPRRRRKAADVAVAELAKNQLLLDFRRRSIFDFCNNLPTADSCTAANSIPTRSPRRRGRSLPVAGRDETNVSGVAPRKRGDGPHG